jgi:hypothetical protein
MLYLPVNIHHASIPATGESLSPGTTGRLRCHPKLRRLFMYKIPVATLACCIRVLSYPPHCFQSAWGLALTVSEKSMVLSILPASW